MTYRKFRADYLFDGTILNGPDTVLVTTEEGRVEALLPLAEAGEGIEYMPGILSPGFVNCHCHLELSHMKGVIPEATGLVDFLLGVMGQRNAHPQPAANPNSESDRKAMIRESIAAAETEMLHNGIVAIGDICNTADTLPLKMEGRLYYHNFIEAMGFIGPKAPERFAQSLQTFQAFAEAYSLPIEANSIVPHAPYSVSSPLFKLIARFPGNHVLSIHNQETEAENEFFKTGKGDFLRLYQAMGLDLSFFTGTGKRSLESYLPHFYRNQTLILVHNVATTQEDLQAAQRSPANLYFCLCPNANLYISGQLPPIDLLISHYQTIVIGTDSLASNHQLSILEELKTLAKAYPYLETAQLLQWATRNGAQALQLQSELGSFEKGKQPGVLVIDQLQADRLTNASRVKRLI